MDKTPTQGVPDGHAAGTSSAPDSRGGTGDGHSARRISVKVAATIAVLAICAALAGAATWSNLNATATNPSNSFTAGTVDVSSNSGSSAVLSLTNAKPGAVSTGCIKVTYTGTLPASVKLYGTGGGTGLNPYLNMVVTRGTFSGAPAAGSCTGFTADTTNYIAAGAGVIYSGTLAGWPASAATALADPTAASPATWSQNSTRGYQFQVTLQGNSAGQGLTGTETLTFEADNT
ncbi:MAG: TasA family protein [Solirubrobacteraceae bacterium]